MWQTNPLEQFLSGAEAIRPAFCTAVVQPIAESRTLQRTTDSASDSHRAATAYLQQKYVAVIVLRPDKQILCLNSAAKRLLLRNRCLRVQSNRLMLANPRRDLELGRFLVARRLQPVDHSFCLRLTCSDEVTPPLLLTTTWLALAGPDSEHAALLQFHQPHVVPQLRTDVLVALYDLTLTEARLVACLFHHPAIDSAADRCSISINTAKSHLKRVFIKCGVSSKAELLRLLALGPHSI